LQRKERRYSAFEAAFLFLPDLFLPDCAGSFIGSVNIAGPNRLQDAE
jgi:hypothetical protein